MHVSDLLHPLYARRLRRQVSTGPLPRHVGLIIDGNRRWARQKGLPNPSIGHQYGADHIQDVQAWCESLGIRHLTVFLCSTENLQRRGDKEVAFLLRVIEEMVADRLARPGARWRVHVAGLLDMLPDTTARALKNAVEATRDCATGFHLTLAIGYGGRQEVIDALRELLYERAEAGQSMHELAETLTADDLAGHLYTAGQPDPDLVIRTSGEQRMSNFLLWQSAYSELYFCEAYWPAFREIDFLRALRSFAARQRRFGGVSVNHDEVLSLYERRFRREPKPEMPGAVVERAGAVVRQSGPAPCWNGVLWSDLDESTADAAIADQIRHYAELGTEFEWKLYGHDRPADLDRRLLAAGFTAEPPETLMVAETARIAVPAAVPAAEPEWRGRGVYRALVAYRARDALARGYRYLQVDASAESRPILARLGFAALATTTPYTHG